MNFSKFCAETLNKQTEDNKGNQSPFIHKEVSKAIMKRTNSVTNFLNMKQMKKGKHLLRNLIIVSLFQGNRKAIYYKNLNVKNITDNKKFLNYKTSFFR